MEENFDIRNNKNGEKEFENALRPLTFDDFKGQNKIVENLKIFVQAARMRTESLDHVLLHGPPGFCFIPHYNSSELYSICCLLHSYKKFPLFSFHRSTISSIITCSLLA